MTRLATIAEALRFKNARWLLGELLIVAIALAFSLLAAVALVSELPEFLDPPSTPVSVVLAISIVGIQLIRRRWPIANLVISSGLLLTIRLLEVPEFEVSGLAWVVSLFAVGRHGMRPWRDIARAAAVVSMLGLLAVEIVRDWDDYILFELEESTWTLIVISQVLANVFLFLGAWLFGDFARKRNDRERELAARTMELEASREENARRAVMDERVRIAREIHDVVAHHVSVMGVQAGAARRAVKVDSDRAEAPLRAIEDSSREAVQELHRLLGFLRRVDEPDPDGLSPGALMPRPSLERLPELRRQLADAGLAIRLTVTGVERPLPPSVDLSAYRILQEALTNCLKYSGVDHADVEIAYEPDLLRVAVRDRGRGLAGAVAVSLAPSSGGAGLPGMAERVALLGGTLHHGERAGGGFEVVAELPFDGQVSAAPSTMPEGANIGGLANGASL